MNYPLTREPNANYILEMGFLLPLATKAGQKNDLPSDRGEYELNMACQSVIADFSCLHVISALKNFLWQLLLAKSDQ